MSNNSLLEAKSATDSSNLQTWDDDLLIKAYNSSVKLANEQLAKRIASATNSKRDSVDGSSKSEELDEIGNAEEKKAGYEVGSYVRATFDDGCDYEAKILSIDDSKGICLVKYIGYDNEQNVQLTDLIPSWGKKARRLQFARAKMSGAAPSEESTHAKTKATSSSTKKTRGRYVGEFAYCSVPPPPPMPPMLAQNMEDSEHLSAMLMSWYMSGYYTGVYQGIQMQKTKSKAHK